jgi:hypothetical protein
MFLGLESPFDTSFLGSPGCAGKMTAASAEWAQYATAPRQRPMLVAYSGCIAQIKHYSLAGARTRDLAERTCLLAQEFKRIGCRLCWLCMKGFPERWIIILRAVYPCGNFPHSHLVGRVGEQQRF